MSDETRATDRPATFRDVFASREYRYLYGATALSWIGDYLAKAAVTALVFSRTHSVALSAAAFALSFVPWLTGGPFLAAMAERLPYRSVMVTCDVVRTGLMTLVAIPTVPVWAMLLLLFANSLANPPFQAARSALLPQVLTGDRYVVGLSLQISTMQAAQLVGYLVGAGLAPFYPRLALLLNATTFAASALLIKFGVGDRRPIGVPAERQHLLQEAAGGFRIVFGSRVLRAIAIVAFSAVLFAIVPEGLAAGWADEFATKEADRGWIQGMIMMASPVGFILGGLVVGRLVSPERRRQLIRVFAVLAPLALVPAMIAPPVWVIVGLAAICGFAVAGTMPAANGLFVQALPAGYRARAYGVMQGGVQTAQAVAVLATGALAERFDIPVVVGWWSLVGAGLLLLVAIRWPNSEAVERAVAAAQAANGRHSAPGDGAGTPPSDVPAPGRHRAGGPVETAPV